MSLRSAAHALAAGVDDKQIEEWMSDLANAADGVG